MQAPLSHLWKWYIIISNELLAEEPGSAVVATWPVCLAIITLSGSAANSPRTSYNMQQLCTLHLGSCGLCLIFARGSKHSWHTPTTAAQTWKSSE